MVENLGVARVECNNTFTLLLIEIFFENLPNDPKDVKASLELSTLGQKEDNNLCKYHCQIKDLLKKIQRQDQIKNSDRNIVILRSVKQQLHSYIIKKFILAIKNLDFLLYVVKYKANPTTSLYDLHK